MKYLSIIGQFRSDDSSRMMHDRTQGREAAQDFTLRFKNKQLEYCSPANLPIKEIKLAINNGVYSEINGFKIRIYQIIKT
jgi:hypothetical protein